MVLPSSTIRWQIQKFYMQTRVSCVESIWKWHIVSSAEFLTFKFSSFQLIKIESCGEKIKKEIKKLELIK